MKTKITDLIQNCKSLSKEKALAYLLMIKSLKTEQLVELEKILEAEAKKRKTTEDNRQAQCSKEYQEFIATVEVEAKKLYRKIADEEENNSQESAELILKDI